MPGQDDDGKHRLAAVQLVLQVQAVLAMPQANVQHEAARARGIIGGEELFTRSERLDGESRRLQQRAQRLAYTDVVVHDEDGRFRRHVDLPF